MFRFPELAGHRVPGKSLRVAMAVAPDGRQRALFLDERIVSRHRAVVIVGVAAAGVNPVDATNRADPSWAGIDRVPLGIRDRSRFCVSCVLENCFESVLEVAAKCHDVAGSFQIDDECSVVVDHPTSRPDGPDRTSCQRRWTFGHGWPSSCLRCPNRRPTPRGSVGLVGIR